MLVRTLLELAINTKYILQKDTRKRLALFNDYDYVLRDKMINSVNWKNRSELKNLAKELGVSIPEIRKKARDHMLTYKKGDKYDSWSKTSVYEMARTTRLRRLYLTVYALGSQLIHSASRSFNEYLKTTNNGGALELQTYPSNNYVNESLIYGFTSYLLILGFLNKVFKLNVQSKLESLLADQCQLLEREKAD